MTGLNPRLRSDLKSINKIDLKPISKAIADKKLLRSKEIPVGEELYRLFLFLKKSYPKIRTVPHPMADVFWHEHILHTRKYQADCNKVFGRYLHHTPWSPQKLRRAHKRTIDLINKLFP